MTVVEVPHLAFPFRLTQGADLPGQVPHAPLALVEQDTIDDVRQCVFILLRTPPGARPLAPEVGVADPTFTSGVDAQQLAAELEQFEDRARVQVTTPAVTPGGRQTVQILVALINDQRETT